MTHTAPWRMTDSTMAAVPPPTAPPGWYPDPTQRNEYRYWDGAGWSDHVANRGSVARDPIEMPQSPKKTTCSSGSCWFGIVGEASYQFALRRISQGRRERGEEVKFEALVRREPENPYDGNAVQVVVNGVGTVGYFRRSEAAQVQPALLAIENAHQVLACNALLIGGENGGHLGVLLDLDLRKLSRPAGG